MTRHITAARNAVWELLIVKYGLSYQDVALVCREVAKLAE